jgi:hypothetical protein
VLFGDSFLGTRPNNGDRRPLQGWQFGDGRGCVIGAVAV